MTNEQLVVRIQAGETDLMSTLWEQVKLFAYKQAWKFYKRQTNRCLSLCVGIEDLQQEAYLAIYQAVEAFDIEKCVKFLTYAGYHLIKCFYTSVGLHRATRKYAEYSLDYIIVDNAKGGNLSLLDILPDQTAEAEIENAIEREYLSQVGEILNKALNCLSAPQRETAINCYGKGLSYSEYARQEALREQQPNKPEIEP